MARLLVALLVGVACAARVGASEFQGIDPPTPQEAITVVTSFDSWVPATVHIGEERKRGAVRLDGETLIYRRRPDSDKEERFPVSELTEVEFPSIRHALLRKAEVLFTHHRYDEALEQFAELEKIGKHPYIALRRMTVERSKAAWERHVDQLETVARTGDPSGYFTALKGFVELVGERSVSDEVRLGLLQTWQEHVARLSEAERERWQDLGDDLKVPLDWDEDAPEYLAAGRAAYAAGDWKEASEEFARADEAHAAMEQMDYVHYGEALLELGRREQAAMVLWRLDPETRNRADLRELMVRGGVLSPPVKPELLVSTWVGGANDQFFDEVGFGPDGSIYGAHGGGLRVVYSPDGGECRGISGNPDAACEGDRFRSMAVRLTKTNPFDGTEWQVGYRQVSSNLQQPYLFSPHGWRWWKWWYSICNPKNLMSDSRAIDLWFPNPQNFIVWAWSDGGNSTIDRDPRDLDQKNRWTRGYFGGGTKIMLGEQRTGEPITGFNMPGRPRDACMDSYGNFYIAGIPRGMDDRALWGADGSGVTIANADLQIQAIVRFGKVTIHAMAVQGDKLVLGGSVGRSAGTDRKGRTITPIDPNVLEPKNPAQEAPGKGMDAFLAIVDLW
ncbi:MAG: hypothetical protein ACOCZK_05885 [Planctomycetota bacterium]